MVYNKVKVTEISYVKSTVGLDGGCEENVCLVQTRGDLSTSMFRLK